MAEVSIIGGNYQYDQLFYNVDHRVVSEALYYRADLVVFTGGEDVSPSFYGQGIGHKTQSNITRDREEAKIFNVCKEMMLPMVGICRGGQFLNVMNKGKMLQHVEGHGKAHMVQDIFDDWYLCSSTHHQMMVRHPSGLQVAWANEGCYKSAFIDGEYKEVDEITDTEVIFYKDTESLCFQPHPEFPAQEYENMREKFFFYIEEFIGIKT